jgi:hypothetical protein
LAACQPPSGVHIRRSTYGVSDFAYATVPTAAAY